MPTEKEREKYWKIYKGLPKSLQEAAFSEEVSDNIDEICKKYGVFENVDKIIEYVGRVFFGLLPPDEFQETLEKELEIEKETAKKATQEIYRFVFHPVKTSLEELYSMEFAPLAKMRITPTPQEKAPAPPTGEDRYREEIE